MQGRLSRGQYFWRELAILVLMYVIAWTIVFLIGESGGYATAVGLIVFILFSIGAVILTVIHVIKRLHDLNRPGSHYWLLFIPFYNIYLGLILHFRKGTNGSNTYGPDPLTRTAHHQFSEI